MQLEDESFLDTALGEELAEEEAVSLFFLDRVSICLVHMILPLYHDDLLVQ